MGRYPYPPETYNNIFSQLSVRPLLVAILLDHLTNETKAIVDGDPPDLPADGYSPLAREFVRGCLNKIPKMRPTYSALLSHPWLAELSKPAVIAEEDEDEEADGEVEVGYSGTEDKEVAEWVINAMERKRKGLMGVAEKPALHAAPLDVGSPGLKA
jgi:mitogen-activated protein kinase kinase